MDNPRTDKDAPTLWYKTRYMLREGTTGEIAEGRGIEISRGRAPREWHGGHACKIAKWKTGGYLYILESETSKSLHITASALK